MPGRAITPKERAELHALYPDAQYEEGSFGSQRLAFHGEVKTGPKAIKKLIP